MSIVAGLLPIIALPVSVAQAEPTSYEAAVTFIDGECRFWTGDVGLTAREFQSDLASGFDRRLGIIISYPPDTPARCVELARRSANRAGFKQVTASIRADAGAIDPPRSDR